MKRFHVNMRVEDIAGSVRFYSALFGSDPTILKPDYAKWMLEDPRVNFAISTHGSAAPGLDHLGIQVENEGELREVEGRLSRTGGPVVAQGDTTCCYAESEKSWVQDPQGVSWETFLTKGESTVYGSSSGIEFAQPKSACCAPTPSPAPMAATACCART